jgi:hypothetical protein
MWVTIYMCKEAMLRISLYSYLYLKLANTLFFFKFSVMFSLQQNGRTRGKSRFWQEVGGDEGRREGGSINVYTCK